MIRDPLYRAIQKRLAGSVGPDTFEICAASLLRTLYPALVPVRGGSDAGMDAYSGPAEGEPILMICTTGDRALDNLRRNICSYVTSGGAARRAILATSRFIGGIKRRNLEAAATELGFVLLQVFDAAWFADELYRSPRWRQELLALSGDPPALSRIPPTRLPAVPVPLLGRDDDVRALREIDDDLVIFGEPGVGKSALLRLLAEDEWGLFVASQDPARLADGIREQEPARVILDDAHFHPARLVELRHLRDEIGAVFRIVAVTWPGHAGDVQSQLQASRLFLIEPLPRDVILQVVEQVGVRGPVEFQRALVDQARGRPGLAATLALLAIRGAIHEVASGEALFRETEVVYRQLLGDQSATILGLIALSGDAGIRLEAIADALRLDLASVRRLVAGLASGGTIDESGAGALLVQPEALRYSAVRQVFFGGPGSLPPEPALQVLDDPGAAAVPLVGAVHRGAVVDDSMLRSLVQQARDSRSVEAYATLGEAQARFALSLAPNHAVPIAIAALDHSPNWALHELMRVAVADNRARQSYPEHPMRKISDWIASGGIDERRTLLDVAADWIESGNDGDVGLEAIAYSLSPAFGRVTTDPGRGNTVTIRRGLLPPNELRAVTGVGDRALELIPVPGCKNYSPLLEVLGDWLFPRRAGFQGELPKGVVNLMRRSARRFTQAMTVQLAGHPGLLARLQDLARQAGLRVRVDISPDFRALFPTREVGNDWREIERRQRATAIKLAKKLASEPPAKTAELVTACDRQAVEAGINYPRYVPDVCRYLADESANPEQYIEALVKRAAAPDHIHPFLEVGVRRDRSGSLDLLAGLLGDERYRGLAIVVVLSHPVRPELQAAAVGACDGRVVHALESLVIREQLDPGALPALLEHPDLQVARAVAVELRLQIRSMSADIRAKWEDAIIRCPADEAWYPEIMSSRPKMLARWVRAWLARQRQPPHNYEPIPEALLALVGELPWRIRRYLLTRVTGLKSIVGDDLVAVLVGEDERLVEFLFATPGLSDYQSEALRGRPGPTWLRRAKVAVRHGWPPDEIVRACLGSHWMISGPESEHWDRWLKEFKELGKNADSDAQALSLAGVGLFSAVRDRAAQREHHAAVYGER